MFKKWQYYENNNKEEAEKIEKELKLNKLLSGILANRGKCQTWKRQLIE